MNRGRDLIAAFATVDTVRAWARCAVGSISALQSRCTPSPRLRGEGGVRGLPQQCDARRTPLTRPLRSRPLPPSGGRWSLRRALWAYPALLNAATRASHARQRQLPRRGPARRRHRAGGHGPRARGPRQGRGGDAGAQIPLHRDAGGRRPLSRHRQVDAGVHHQAVRGGRRHPARRLRIAAHPLSRQYRDHAAGRAALHLRPLCRGAAVPADPERAETEARETLVITRKTSQRLFDFSFRLARRRKARGRRGLLTCVDKANAFKAYAFFRAMFDECAARHPDVATDRLYVDACSAMLVRRPWDFDVLVMENMFGDIISDLTAGLIGGMGMAPSADIGDTHAVFQPCHGTAPDIMGKGLANPTAMILSAALMLDWLADRHGHAGAAQAARAIEHAVDRAFAAGLAPCEFGGRDGTAAIAGAVLRALDASMRA